MLSDLSSFVKAVKCIESAVNGSDDGEAVETDMVTHINDMVNKAFKMVTRAVKFLDIWDDHMQSIEESISNVQVPPTPPADRSEFGSSEKVDHLASVATHHNATDIHDARGAKEQTKARTRLARSSQTYIRPGSSNSCRQSLRPVSMQGTRDFVSHRVSCHVHPGSQNLASDKLAVLHNTFLTYLGYFIGLHIQSRSSTELLLSTKQSVLSCKDMLELVGEIWERDWRRSRVLEEARENMYKRIAELAEAAHDIFRPLRCEDDDDFLLPGQGKPLVEAATACVRAAGDCVAESRFVIERIGDFDFEPLGLGLSEFDSANSTAPVSEPLSAVKEEQRNSTREPSSPVPPQPSSRPPPPPLRLSDSHLPIGSEMSVPPAALEPLPESTLPEPTTPQCPATDIFLPSLPPFAGGLLPQEDFCFSAPLSIASAGETKSFGSRRVRTDSLGVSSAGDSSAYMGSMRDSETSIVSQTSTRATSPAANCPGNPSNLSLRNSFVGGQRTLYCDNDDPEVNILERTFAHELVYNKDGQITGGTLPALIERLTTPDSTPDATFVSTFYLTFRLFATPVEFAQALMDRFQYVSECSRVAGPVRLRVYNVFKGWLESHWRNDCDKPALDLIVSFATRQLQIMLPTAGKRLASLAEQVTAVDGPLVPRLISSIGKTNTSIAQYIAPDAPLPPSIVTKSQLTALKNWKHGGATINITDFDPLELARQFTLKESQIFCSILPEELLASEWTKKSGSMAVNVRAMSRLSTDLANLVADCILQVEDPKKRAITIKQWVKIAKQFLELANYHSLMAIVCSLTQSTIGRLKRTWELVSSKTKATLEHLKSVVAHDRNFAALRQRLQNHVPPCVPFVGLYLTDLTFVDAGNQTTRQLPGVGSEGTKSVINFDKHMKTAKIISELQRFQIPYRFHEIPELQTWMQDQLVRVRTADQSDVVKDYYRRSLLLEPREQLQCKASPADSQASTSSGRERFELFSTLGWSHHSREKLALTPS